MTSKTLQSPLSPDLGLALIRGMVGVVFVYHGAQKVFGAFGGPGLEGFAGWLGSLGFPFPYANAVAAGLTELVGGLALLAGLFTVPAGVLLAGTMVVAALTAHTGFSAQTGGMEYPLTLAFVSLGLALTGPGRFSLAALGSAGDAAEEAGGRVVPLSRAA